MAQRERKNPTPRARGVFERPTGSGIWWARYTDENGQLHREKVGSKSLARKVYHKRKTEIHERRFFPERHRQREVALAAMIDECLRRWEGRLRSYTEYARHGETWKTVLAGKMLRQVLPGDIERYLAERIKIRAPATVNRELAFIKRVFNVAIDDGHVETNPARRVRLYKENNARVRYLTDDELPHLRSAIGEEQWLLVAFALNTGLRQGEQFGLRWDCVDSTTKLITIPRSKSGETRRVPMNEATEGILARLRANSRGPFVFASETGTTALDAKNYMNRVFRPALRSAGIQNFRWHDLRHTFASRLVMAGVDIRTVQELMGHKTIEMTLRYAHLSPEHQLSAVQKLNFENRTDTRTDTAAADEPPDAAEGTEPIVLEDETGAPGTIRTCDPQIRSLVLYPTELRARTEVPLPIYKDAGPEVRRALRGSRMIASRGWARKSGSPKSRPDGTFPPATISPQARWPRP